MNSEYLGREGYRFMGAVFEVYKELGHGLGEEIYQESLELELAYQNIPFSPKEQLTVFYKGQPLRKLYVPDLFVFEEIVVEIKSVKALMPEHDAQLMSYMRITKKAVGYLVNFGTAQQVEWKRFILREFVPKEPLHEKKETA